MRRGTYLLVCLFGVVIAGVATGEEPAPMALSLRHLEDRAGGHPDINTEVHSIEAARGRAQQAGLYPNPYVAVGTNQLGGEQTQYVGTIAQEIIVKNKRGLNRAAAETEVREAELSYVATRFSVLTAVRRGFGSVLASQRRVDMLEQLVTVASQSVETSQKLREAGEGTQTDILLLQVELQRNQVALQNAEAQLEANRRMLAAVIGDPKMQIGPLDGDLARPLPDYDFEYSREKVAEENANVLQAQVDIDRRRFLLQRAKVEPCPNVTIDAGYQWTVVEPNNQAIVMLGFALPTWDRNQGNIRAAAAELAQSHQQLDSVRAELSGELADAIGRYRSAAQQVERFERDILPTARQALNLTLEGYRQGQFDFLRLLEAQRSFVQTDLGYVDALEQRWLAAADIAGLLQFEEFPPQSETSP